MASKRASTAGGQLDALSEKLLFSPTRPAEELYEWTTDPRQVQNLATDSKHAQTLAEMRARLNWWMKESNDHGPESDLMYDSDVLVYRGKGNPVLEKNRAHETMGGRGEVELR